MQENTTCEADERTANVRALTDSVTTIATPQILLRNSSYHSRKTLEKPLRALSGRELAIRGAVITDVVNNRASSSPGDASSLYVAEADFASSTLSEPPRQNSLLLARNGYNRLATLATQLKENQVLLTRGMSCAQSEVANVYHGGTRKILSIFGVDYAVPDLRETVQLQLSHVRQYGMCIDEILTQTATELKSTHDYVRSLAKDVIKYTALKEKLAPNMALEHSSQFLSNLQAATYDISQLETFLETHNDSTQNLLRRSNYVVADRVIQRKSEYLRHAYAVELLLIGSLSTAKKIAVDAGCYGSMLDRLASAYFNLGCNSSQLGKILEGLQTMQKFTDGMQSSVAQGLERLDKALIDTRTTIGPKLEIAVSKMRS